MSSGLPLSSEFMLHFPYDNSPYPVREGLGQAHQQYWQALASPGTWFSGAERIAIAQDVRNALQCDFCKERKAALSPYSVSGVHHSETQLPEHLTDLVHRVITDPSRITQSYIDDLSAHDQGEEKFVEAVGVAVTVLSIDEFNRALGLALEPLPQAIEGAPSSYRPRETARGTGYVAMISPDGAIGPDSDLWQKGRTANVLRALSLVPNAVREWMAVGDEQYLSMQGMTRFTEIPGRELNRMQIELVAGRVSSINECFY